MFVLTLTYIPIMTNHKIMMSQYGPVHKHFLNNSFAESQVPAQKKKNKTKNLQPKPYLSILCLK